MNIDEFNALPDDAARDQLLICAGIPSWADAVLTARPFPDRATALRTAEALATGWQDDEVDAALADHPRIGERRGTPDAQAEHSQREQGALALDAEVESELLAVNAAYEERFDRVFLIRAAGRSSGEIIDEARRRLTNSDEEERRERSAQLREIAVLRLARLLDGGEDA